MTWRGDEIEEQLSNELEAHWDEWLLTGVGDSTIWITPGTTPHPELLAWCAKNDYSIEEWDSDPPSR